mmetsp:Transcript_12402/g.18371  ORF Transcript_12402/g.18371 Transcript_12402/m.18371 type:complete len:80 (+) Transcript_12402:779-1018(+)
MNQLRVCSDVKRKSHHKLTKSNIRTSRYIHPFHRFQRQKQYSTFPQSHSPSNLAMNSLSRENSVLQLLGYQRHGMKLSS